MHQFEQLLIINRTLRQEFHGLLLDLKQSVRDLSNFNQEAKRAVTELEKAIETELPSPPTN